MPSTNKQTQLRLRVFAGPNGSGKSTVIEYVRKVKVNGRAIDFGYYINADDIARQLRNGGLEFSEFDLDIKPKDFIDIALGSGLINDEFPPKEFLSSFSLRANLIRLKNKLADERMAQVIADFLRKKMLEQKAPQPGWRAYNNSILFQPSHRRSINLEFRHEKQKKVMMYQKKK